MAEPTDNQINKRIAEFMKWYWLDNNWIKPVGVHTEISNKLYFIESIDSLIPVLIKWYYPKNFEKTFRCKGFKLLDLIKEIAIAIMKKKSPSRALALALFNVLDDR